MVNQNLFLRFMKFLSIISFLIANFVIFFTFLLFSSLKHTSILYNILFFTVGFLIAVVFIRPNWLLNYSKSSNRVSGHRVLKSLFAIKWRGPKIFILMIPRTLFFTILNDMFLVLIIWAGYFWITAVLGFVRLDPTSLNLLFGTLSVIGIISGLFQFYFKYYRDEVLEKTSNAIVDHFKQFLRELSPREFSKFLKENNRTLYDRIRQKTSAEFFASLPNWIRIQRARDKINTQIIVPYLPQEYIFTSILESVLEEDEKQELNEMYKKFFEKKVKQIEEEIKNLNVEDIREIFMLNPFLVDDIWMMMTKVKYSIPIPEENPTTFEDHLINAVNEILLYFTKRVVGEVE